MMSHVEIPPCPYPKADNKLRPLLALKKKVEKKERAASQVKVHPSLGEALEASLKHNDAMGVIGEGSGWSRKKKEKKDAQSKFRNPVTGSSKSSFALEPSSNSNNIHSKKKRHISDDGQLNDPKKKQKMNHVDIDLTLSGDEERFIKKPETNLLSPRPRPLPKRKSNKAKYAAPQPVIVGIVKPLPVDVWSLNTRFMRHRIKKATIPLPSPTRKRRKDSSRRSTPGFLPLSSPQSDAEDDEVSLGDPIPTSWREDFDDDEDIPNVLPDPLSEAKQSSQPSSAPSATPKSPESRKIDLAAFYRNKDKLKGRASSSKTPAKSSPNRLKLSTTNISPAGLATPSVSQSHLLATGSSPEFHREHEQQASLAPITPSAKALGKRRALSPASFTVPSQPTSSPDLLPGHVGTQDFDNFIHEYTVASPNQQAYDHSLALSTRYSPTLQPTILPSYQPGSSLGLATESFQTMDGIYSFDLQDQQTPFWSSLEGSIPEYQYTTVDPTLLGGTPMFEEPSEAEHASKDRGQSDNNDTNDEFAGLFEGSEYPTDAQSESLGPVAGPSVIRNRHSSKERSFSVSSSSNSALRSEHAYTPTIDTALPQDASMKWKTRVSRSGSRSVYEQDQEQLPEQQERSGSEYMPSTPSPKRNTIPLRRKSRQVTSPSPYDPEVLSEKEYAPSTTSNYEPPPSAQAGSKEKQPRDREPSQEVMRTLPKRQRTQKQRVDMVDLNELLDSTDSQAIKGKEVNGKGKGKGKGKAPGPGPKSRKERSDLPIWPTCAIASYCHQCRNKSDLIKMDCSSCNAIFCIRCIKIRYVF